MAFGAKGKTPRREHKRSPDLVYWGRVLAMLQYIPGTCGDYEYGGMGG